MNQTGQASETQTDPAAAGNADAGVGASQDQAVDAGQQFFDGLAKPFRAPDDPGRQRSRGAQTQEAPKAGDASLEAGKKPEDEGKTAEEGDKPYAVYKTKEDHDRAVQAEHDRREAKRLKDEAIAERKRLRTEDPEAFARLDEELEQKGQETDAHVETAKTVIGMYDGAVLQPLLAKLPDDKRLEIESTIDSLPARTAAIEKALDHLISAARADGEKAGRAKAREDPAFRKEVLRDYRGERPALDLIEGGARGASSGASTNDLANAFLRRGAHVKAS